MKIALITDGIWPYVMGGMQKHSFYLCKYLAKNKINVDLIHFNQSNLDITKLEYFTEEEKKYINSIVIDFPRSVQFPGHYIYNSYRYSKHAFQKIKDQLDTYDFIYTKGFTGWYLMDQKQKGHVKCCSIGVKFHGYEMFQTAPELKIKLQHIFLLRAPVKSISKKADVVFSYGGKITDLIKSIGVKPNNIIELSSGIEKTNLIAEIKPSGSKINFLYLGRYERRKGIEELNKALNDLIRNDQKDFTFHFIGNIPEQKKLNSTHVIYHSEIRDKHILQEKIRAADVLICPSYSEGFPNVILEAMANGLAVAATPVGAVELLVNNTNGWIIENSSSSEIKKVLLNIIKEDKQVIDEKKKSALTHIKSAFIWDDLIQTFLNEIKRFI